MIYRVRFEEIKDFLPQVDGFVFRSDVCSVLEVLGNEYNTDQWCLFIDSSKVRLKLVLLNKGKRLLSVPLVHAANMKEICESMRQLLGKIMYDEFNWKLLGDLKVVALLLGMQLGYTKYCCFLCECDTRDQWNHCVNKLWPKRTSMTRTGDKCRQSSSCSSREIFFDPFAFKVVRN